MKKLISVLVLAASVGGGAAAFAEPCEPVLVGWGPKCPPGSVTINGVKYEIVFAWRCPSGATCSYRVIIDQVTGAITGVEGWCECASQ